MILLAKCSLLDSIQISEVLVAWSLVASNGVTPCLRQFFQKPLGTTLRDKQKYVYLANAQEVASTYNDILLLFSHWHSVETAVEH